MKSSRLSNEDEYKALREQMVVQQIEARGVRDKRVLEAMRRVPRHLFVSEKLRPYAHDDAPLSIGKGQTISQPFIVALMTELLHPEPHKTILEIGTGSGYQTAVLADIVNKVYSIEIIPELSQRAEEVFKLLGYSNIFIRNSDGYYGWPEAAPFDCIIVTAAPEKVPQLLLEQLKEGGRMVIPVGDGLQFLEVYIRENDTFKKETNIPVRFVPMTGEAKKHDKNQ
jgi:protein-L-isoaspartate(D-aspartate) O-methyltransferase